LIIHVHSFSASLQPFKEDFQSFLFDSSRGYPLAPFLTAISNSPVKFICIAHFMYKTIQSALHKIKALQRGAKETLKIHKRNKIIEMQSKILKTSNSLDKLKDTVQISCIDT